MRMTDALAGAIGGLAAGAALTAMMEAALRLGLIQEPLPEKVEGWAEDEFGFGSGHSSAERKMVAQSAHLLASAGLGALYGALRPRRGSIFPEGPLFGLGIYAASLAGAGPALGITQGPWAESPAVSGRRVMMHLIFGTITAAVTEKIAPRVQAP